MVTVSWFSGSVGRGLRRNLFLLFGGLWAGRWNMFTKFGQAVAETVGITRKTKYSAEYQELSLIFDSTTQYTGLFARHIEEYANLFGEPDAADQRKKSKRRLLTESIDSLSRVIPQGRYADSIKKTMGTLENIVNLEQEQKKELETEVVVPLRKWTEKAKNEMRNERKILEQRRLVMDAASRRVEGKTNATLEQKAEKQVTANVHQEQLEKVTGILRKIPEEHKIHNEVMRQLLRTQLKYHQKCRETIDSAIPNF